MRYCGWPPSIQSAAASSSRPTTISSNLGINSLQALDLLTRIEHHFK